MLFLGPKYTTFLLVYDVTEGEFSVNLVTQASSCISLVESWHMSPGFT